MIELRPELKAAAIACELEMRKKDKLGYTSFDQSVDQLWTKLIEERKEVDECIESSDYEKFIKEESLHEIIMLALLRERLRLVFT